MRFAIAIPTDSDSWRVVRRAEELGFHRAWFYDTQMLSADPFVAMAAAAMKTTKIRLATGVLIPSNRLAAVAANAFASLNKLAPGRVDFGIGTGFTGRRAMGLGAVTLKSMEEYIRVAQALLRDETVEAEIEGKQRLIRLLNPELGLINTRDPIPLYIAATGPRARALTAKLAAGWINTAGDVAGAAAGMKEMAGLWTEAGHKPEVLDAVVLTGGAVLRDGEALDSDRVVAQARPARGDVAAPRRRPGARRLSADGVDAAAARRDHRRLYRTRSRLPPARRALPGKPSRAPDVRQARGAPFRHRRP